MVLIMMVMMIMMTKMIMMMMMGWYQNEKICPDYICRVLVIMVLPAVNKVGVGVFQSAKMIPQLSKHHQHILNI